jgi:hypothetical protein
MVHGTCILVNNKSRVEDCPVEDEYILHWHLSHNRLIYKYGLMQNVKTYWMEHVLFLPLHVDFQYLILN